MFALLLFALTVIGGLSGESLFKGFISACIGLMLATIGTDTITGDIRFTFRCCHTGD